jgi:hypothetical protein
MTANSQHRFKFQRELELSQEAQKTVGQSMVNRFLDSYATQEPTHMYGVSLTEYFKN